MQELGRSLSVGLFLRCLHSLPGRIIPKAPTLASGKDHSQGSYRHLRSFRATGAYARSGQDSPQGSSDRSAVPGCNTGGPASLAGFSHNRQSHVLSLLIGSSFEPFRPIRACSDLFGPIRTYSDLITRFDGSHGEPIVSVLCLFVLICAYLCLLICAYKTAEWLSPCADQSDFRTSQYPNSSSCEPSSIVLGSLRG